MIEIGARTIANIAKIDFKLTLLRQFETAFQARAVIRNAVLRFSDFWINPDALAANSQRRKSWPPAFVRGTKRLQIGPIVARVESNGCRISQWISDKVAKITVNC